MPSESSGIFRSQPAKPAPPPFWKWLMRVTFAVTMLLFLAPAVCVLKYYGVDKPRAAAKELGKSRKAGLSSGAEKRVLPNSSSGP